jgi:DNA-binding response OmpR family regulator
VRELIARVRAVLRRSGPAAEAQEVIRRGELQIDTAKHEVTYAGQRVSLTATEFRILEFLASRPGRVLSRDDIIDGALGRDASVFNRTIDVHVTALRKKLGPVGGQKIETVRGFGYKWAD